MNQGRPLRSVIDEGLENCAGGAFLAAKRQWLISCRIPRSAKSCGTFTFIRSLQHSYTTARWRGRSRVPAIEKSSSSELNHQTLKDKMSVRNILLKGPLGYGGAPLGNMFRNIPEEEALGKVTAAWDQGIRYFDTAPFYGAGLSEICMLIQGGRN